jgi:hypothetical protein
MRQIEILPPLEEIDGILYDVSRSNFDDIFKLLKI